MTRAAGREGLKILRESRIISVEPIKEQGKQTNSYYALLSAEPYRWSHSSSLHTAMS